MGFVKDLWIDALEARQAELEEAGMDEEAAHERASDEATGIVSERLADLADYYRDRAKYEGF